MQFYDLRSNYDTNHMFVSDESRSTKVAQFSWNWAESLAKSKQKSQRLRTAKHAQQWQIDYEMAIDAGRDIDLCWDCRNQEQQSTARHSVLPAYLATKSWRLKKFFLQNITRIGPLSESTCEFWAHFLKYILLECDGLELLWQRVFVNIVIDFCNWQNS